VRLELSPAAEADLQRIFEFNERLSLPWAEKVEDRIWARASSLIQTPFIGRPTDRPGVRRLSMPDIQYVLDYRIEADRIRMLRIYSTREIS
jgi:plasmid stabilization system protein ParE